MSINLLPPGHKADIIYARHNTVLKNWIIASCIGVAGIILVLAAGYFFINQSEKTTQVQVNNARTQLSAQKQDEVQKQVTSISDGVKLTLQVLQRQIFFSKLLVQVGAVMPPGTSLDTLTINSTQGGIDLSVFAQDYQAATQVQINITDPSKKLFEKADILSVTCTPATATATTAQTYPCKSSIRALFAKDSSFQYVNSAGTK
jgi:hypothetical protein